MGTSSTEVAPSLSPHKSKVDEYLGWEEEMKAAVDEGSRAAKASECGWVGALHAQARANICDDVPRELETLWLALVCAAALGALPSLPTKQQRGHAQPETCRPGGLSQLLDLMMGSSGT